jgi:hypothetical protein
VKVNAATLDPNDNIYVAIQATDGSVFGDLPPLSGGNPNYDGQLLKISSQGEPLWVQQVGPAIVVAADGSGVVTSDQQSVTKRDTNGAMLWQTQAYNNNAIAVAPDSWLVGGSLYGSDVSIGTGTIVGTSGSPWVAHLNADGSFKSGVSLPGRAEVTALSVDSANNIYAAGYGRLDGTSSTFAIFIVKFDRDLTAIWKKSFMGSGSACADCRMKLALDPQGRPVLAGKAPGPIDLGTGTLPETGMFMVAFDQDGNTRWAHTYSTASNSDSSFWTTTLAVSADEITLGGTIDGGVDFGGVTVGGSSGFSGYLAGFDHDGRFRWSRTFSAHGADERAGAWVHGVLLPSSKDVVAVGHLTHCPSSVDFGGGPIACTEPGSQQLFLAAFPP